ncbi:Crp/Fnr family transcriptional regulator [Albimonas pacifica]|uniref:cAMP-binding domain of CRP or a regulatory subunit of cAMP-dependent protein kinases n=1 Tax=Albimonas pacifica TaxID=1114924 RepID=A0A1I3IW54_9RHOB|nr:Crp/Fnr family transcriptional regulator [Albimonas pacifica]SFI52128.1 cAMP-binding domain of CRP or a regulatory subunit of cAMP-dependent protein kinases [Albimonas pacifica]
MTCFHDPRLILNTSPEGAEDALGRVSARPSPRLAEPCASCPARRAAVCAEIPGSLLSRLSRRVTQARLPAGAPLPAEGAGPYLGVLASGWLRWVHFGHDGRRRVLGLVQPGEMIWRPEDPIGSLEAATDVEVCRFDDPSLVSAPAGALAGGGDGAEALDRIRMAQARRELDRLHAIAVGLAVQSPEQRLAGFLAAGTATMAWRPSDGPGRGGVLTVPLSRPDIADLLGTTVESLSRITHRFHADGLIRILDPRRFEIPDVDALSLVARRGSTEVETAPSAPAAADGEEASARAGEPVPCRDPLDPGDDESAAADDEGPRLRSSRDLFAGRRRIQSARPVGGCGHPGRRAPRGPAERGVDARDLSPGQALSARDPSDGGTADGRGARVVEVRRVRPRHRGEQAGPLDPRA